MDNLYRIKVGKKLWKCTYEGYGLYVGHPHNNHGRRIAIVLSDSGETPHKVLSERKLH